MTGINDVHGLIAADIMHRHLAALPATATVEDLQAYFAGGAGRRLAVLVDGARLVGSLTPSDLAGVDARASVPGLACDELRVHGCAPAAVARDRALAHPSRRVPVVDDAGDLIGIVAINRRGDGFCGT